MRKAVLVEETRRSDLLRRGVRRSPAEVRAGREPLCLRLCVRVCPRRDRPFSAINTLPPRRKIVAPAALLRAVLCSTRRCRLSSRRAFARFLVRRRPVFVCSRCRLTARPHLPPPHPALFTRGSMRAFATGSRRASVGVYDVCTRSRYDSLSFLLHSLLSARAAGEYMSAPKVGLPCEKQQ